MIPDFKRISNDKTNTPLKFPLHPAVHYRKKVYTANNSY